jgi:hypothetical protein
MCHHLKKTKLNAHEFELVGCILSCCVPCFQMHRWDLYINNVSNNRRQQFPGPIILIPDDGHIDRGRAIAQAVSHRLPTTVARVQTRVWSYGILWWTKVALGQVFSKNFSFPCQSTFHLLLHNHLHYHPRLAQ